MGKIGGEESPPPGSAAGSGLAFVPEQPAVAAFDKGGGALNQPDDRVAERGCSPGLRGDALGTEHGNRDFPVAGAVAAAIGRLHHLAHPPSLIGCHARIVRDWSCVYGMPETENGLKSVG